MRLDDGELNIRPEVAEFLGYISPRQRREVIPSAEAARAIPGLGLSDIVTCVIGGIVTLFIGFILLAAICSLLTFLNGPVSQTAIAASPSPTPQPARSMSRPARRAFPAGAYLPAEYSLGRLATPIWLVDRMPHGFGTDAKFLVRMPEGTCLLFERENSNGWRRVVSYDGQYVGYAQIFPTVPYKPHWMQPGFRKLISLLRTIP